MGRLFEAICEANGMNRKRYWRVMDYARERLKKGFAALEVGCDDGAYAVGFSMLGYWTVALDPVRTPFMSQLYRYLPMSLEKFAVSGHGLAGQTYEIVHVGEVIEHSKDPDKLMDTACKMCHPKDGKIIVSAPNFMAGGHLRTYTFTEFMGFIEQFIEPEHWYDIPSHVKKGKSQFLAMGAPK